MYSSLLDGGHEQMLWEWEGPAPLRVPTWLLAALDGGTSRNKGVS